MTDFARLIAALDRAEIDQPVLVVDQPALMANLSRLKTQLPKGKNLRLADKSLAAPDLLSAVANGLGTRDLMSFDPGLTLQSLAGRPAAGVLMGKPLPARLAGKLLDRVSADQRRQIVWLIDGPGRLADFAALGRKMGLSLPVAFEVDTGLGRGGFVQPTDLADVLRKAEGLTCRGLMGYDAHAGGLPRVLGGGRQAWGRAEHRLRAFVGVLAPRADWLINTGGSGTILMMGDTVANDLTLGSLAIKPTDFDQPWNSDIQPAMFLVTPVLKTHPHGLPGHPGLSAMMRGLGIIAPKVSFAYGGGWAGQVVHPLGVRRSPFLGKSNNQQGFSHRYQEFDRIILRPDQSDAIIQAVGTIAVFDGDQITAIWPAFRPASSMLFD